MACEQRLQAHLAAQLLRCFVRIEEHLSVITRATMPEREQVDAPAMQAAAAGWCTLDKRRIDPERHGVEHGRVCASATPAAANA